MGTKSKMAVSNQIKQQLNTLSISLRNLQLTIAEAAHALKHHIVVNMQDLQVVEKGIIELDALRIQLISLSSVGHKTCERLERNELLIQSLRSVKTTMGGGINSDNNLSSTYIKSRNSVLSLLKANINNYSNGYINEDINMDEEDKTLTERIKDLLLSSPMKLIDAYCQFFFDIKEKVETRSKKPTLKSNYHSEMDKDIEVMKSLCNLSEAYKDVLLKSFISIEELIGVIKGIHISKLSFDNPLIEHFPTLTLSSILGIALAIRELEDKH